MTTEQITENAKAILLLCGRFGAGDDTGAQPLNIKAKKFAIRKPDEELKLS